MLHPRKHTMSDKDIYTAFHYSMTVHTSGYCTSILRFPAAAAAAFLACPSHMATHNSPPTGPPTTRTRSCGLARCGGALLFHRPSRPPGADTTARQPLGRRWRGWLRDSQQAPEHSRRGCCHRLPCNPGARYLCRPTGRRRCRHRGRWLGGWGLGLQRAPACGHCLGACLQTGCRLACQHCCGSDSGADQSGDHTAHSVKSTCRKLGQQAHLSGREAPEGTAGQGRRGLGLWGPGPQVCAWVPCAAAAAATGGQRHGAAEQPPPLPAAHGGQREAPAAPPQMQERGLQRRPQGATPCWLAPPCPPCW